MTKQELYEQKSDAQNVATKADIERLESKIIGQFASVTSEFSQFKYDILKWVIGLWALNTAVIVAMIVMLIRL